ncbi:MAG: tRNA (adenosine(37)-N6)-dimethylallyltransferase MiaA [Bacillota bacterium]|nr:tRNA (adenosine(37)-N6)-dimethylallyltransferase MiaA [Bacillota bacterium]
MAPSAGRPRLLALTGPTASGKSALALELARRLEGTILSADSMQVYQGLDIGTAKPTAAERAEIPHELLDLVPVTSKFTPADYTAAARAALERCDVAGRTPILCGGTGQYVEAVLTGEDYSGLPYDPDLREKLETFRQAEGLETLVHRLRELDPLRAESIDTKNPRRVIRALEIALAGEGGGARPQPVGLQRPAVLVILDPPRPWLWERIETRIGRMFEAGLAAEARWLLEQNLPADQTAMQAIGYKELFPWLRGLETESQARERLLVATRRYAKRQRTWLRRYSRIQDLEILHLSDSGPDVHETILAFYHVDKSPEAGV